MQHWKNLSLDSLKEEIEGIIYVEKWKPIPNYEGCYDISSFGRIKSKKRLVKHYRGGVLQKSERILKQNLDTDGYPQVLLCKEGISKSVKIHQLVAKVFIKNPENKTTVNHKWGIKTHNMVHQLEWFTVAEQTKHSYEVLKRKLSPKTFTPGKGNPFSKRVSQYDLNDNYIASFNGTREAERMTGFDRQGIARSCRSAGKPYKNYKWKYE